MCEDAVGLLVLWFVAGVLCALHASHMHALRIRCPYVGRAI
jgi:hypothetical protein